MEYLLGLPLEYKIRNGELKKISKDIRYKYIPKELMNRPKQGFGVPHERWLRNELKEELLSYTDIGFLKRQGIFKYNETQKLISLFIEKGDGRKNRVVKALWFRTTGALCNCNLIQNKLLCGF